MLRRLLIGIFIVILLFTRFWNIEKTARFTEDESGFLVRVHQVFVEKKITLVGQVNEQATKVFSSLSVYLLLPFAILGNFDPVSVFYGASFFGVVTVVVMLLLTRKITGKIKILPALLLLFWYPLLLMGRWAWNPNFIPLWISMGILLFLRGNNLSLFLSGICFGSSVHQHYYAIFSVAFFSLIASLGFLKEKKLNRIFLLNGGIVIALLPFIIFDLRHPPGLFLLGASNQAQIMSISKIIDNFFRFSFMILKFHTQSVVLALLVLLALLFTFIDDAVYKNKALFFLLPVIFQIVVISALGSNFSHYYYSIIPFVFVYLVYSREKLGKLFSSLSIIFLIIGGILSLKSLTGKPPVVPDLTTVKKIDKIMKSNIKTIPANKTNVIVLGSRDKNTYGRRYRDLLLIPDNISLLSHNEYFTNDYLFVVSESGEDAVRYDPAVEIQNFRNGKLLKKETIDNGPWTIYLFARGT